MIFFQAVAVPQAVVPAAPDTETVHTSLAVAAAAVVVVVAAGVGGVVAVVAGARARCAGFRCWSCCRGRSSCSLRGGGRV